MRRKIHGVLGIIESVNVQINFDPIFVLAPIRARTHARPSRIAAYRADFIFALPKRICCVCSLIRFRLGAQHQFNHLRGTLRPLLFTDHYSPSKLGWWNWQTRTFEGRMPKGLRVQVPPRARFLERRLRLAGVEKAILMQIVRFY